MTDQDRLYQKGLEGMRKLLGEKAAKRFEENAAKTWLNPAMKDFTQLTTGHAFDIWQRPGLDMRSRSMATMSTLMTQGLWDQFRIHVRNALNIGITPDEIIELLLHLSTYAGLPAANSAYLIAHEVFQKEANRKRGG